MDYTKVPQKTIASIHGVTRQTIYLWEKQGMPRNEDQTYSTAETIEWREERARDEVTEPSEDGDKWLGMYRKERALITAMEREQLEKKLISVDDVEMSFADRAYELSRSLSLMSRRIGQKIAGKTKREYSVVTEIIDDEVRRVLSDYCRDIEIEREAVKK